MMLSSADPEPREYTLLRQETEALAAGGRLDAALAVCERTLTWARHQGNDFYRDQAFCGRAIVLIALGEGDRVVAPLRRLLMRTSHPSAQSLAAKGLSDYYDQQGDFAKGLSFATRALHHARIYGQTRSVVSSLNRLANARWRFGEIEAAARGYSEALEVLGDDGSPNSDPFAESNRGVLTANLGACLVLSGRAREGVRYLSSAHQCILNQPEPWRSEELLCQTQLGLSLGYLNLDRPLIAGRLAETALEAAGASFPGQLRKQALFLLGESTKFAGVEDQARDWFSLLQNEFYPDMPDVVELLMLTDTRDLLNLWG